MQWKRSRPIWDTSSHYCSGSSSKPLLQLSQVHRNCSFVLTTTKVVQHSWSTRPSLSKNARLVHGLKRSLGGRRYTFRPFSFLFSVAFLNSGYLQMISMTLSWQRKVPHKSCWTLKCDCVGVWRARINMLKILLLDFFKFKIYTYKIQPIIVFSACPSRCIVTNVVCVFSKHKHTSGSCPWMSQWAISMSESSHARSCSRSEPRLLIYWTLYAPELPISDSC